MQKTKEFFNQNQLLDYREAFNFSNFFAISIDFFCNLVIYKNVIQKTV